MAGKRDVSFVLQRLRDFLLMRKNTNMLRFRDEVSARTQPPPNIPAGPHHKLAENYYYSRDARRLVTPNNVIFEGTYQPKTEGEAISSATSKTPVLQRVPGKVYLWES